MVCINNLCLFFYVTKRGYDINNFEKTSYLFQEDIFCHEGCIVCEGFWINYDLNWSGLVGYDKTDKHIDKMISSGVLMEGSVTSWMGSFSSF